MYASGAEFRGGDIRAGTIHGGEISGSKINGGSININPTGTFYFIVDGTKDTTGNGNIENLTGKMEVHAKNGTLSFSEQDGLKIDIVGSTTLEMNEGKFSVKSGKSSISCSVAVNGLKNILSLIISILRSNFFNGLFFICSIYGGNF